MRKNILKIILAILGLALSLTFFTKLLTPTWYDWNNDNTMKGIYREPRGRIQVLFLGSSLVINGISPMHLYDQYGICAYNMGTQLQSMLTSYYWLREIYRMQSGTLRIVVLDVSSLFHDPGEEDRRALFVEKALAGMRLSPVKIEALQACEDRYDLDFWEHIFPIAAYHSRWQELTEEDFTGLTDENNYYFTRGQHIDFTSAFQHIDPAAIITPNENITAGRDFSEAEFEQIWNRDEKEYLSKIAEFCEEKGISLVFTTHVKPAADDMKHDAVQYLADEYDVPFIDFNLVEIQEEIGLDLAMDFTDGEGHANAYGGKKLTDYLGSFLRSHYQIDDVRGQKKYSYLEKQAADFSIVEEDIMLRYNNSFTDYLRQIGKGRYTVFLSVKDEAFAGLSPEQKEMLSDLGFTKINEAGIGCSYIGIVDQGKILVNEASSSPQDSTAAEGIVEKNGKFSISGIMNPFNKQKKLYGNYFCITSGGAGSDERSSVMIHNNEYSLNKNGMNFVIYDNQLKMAAGSDSFDTHSETTPRINAVR